MKSTRFALYPFLASVTMLTTSLVPGPAARAEEPDKPKVVPERLTIVGEKPPSAPEVGTTPSAPLEGRVLPPVDATGTRRRPDEPRFITGSFIKQKVELYGNTNNSALNVRTYTQGDLRLGASPLFGTARAPTPPPGGAPGDMIERSTRHYELDLRKVAPERRLAVATKLLGEARGRDLVIRFNRWEAARNKRLAAR